MSIFLSHLGVETVGVENDEAILKRARFLSTQMHGHVEFVPADAFRLLDAFTDRSFDVAFSQGFFEHFSDSDIVKLAEQQLAVARRVVI